MRNYKITIQYDGTRYHGWQSQKSTENTIQAKIQQVLSKMVNHEVIIHGSGRTDTGVHAKAQVAHFHLSEDYSCAEIKEYLNCYLPDDIAILMVTEASQRFHSRLNAIGKHYCYTIEQSPKSDVFNRKYVYTLGANLDVEAMQRASLKLCGTHDFKSFCSSRSAKKTTIRTLNQILIEQQGSQLFLHFEGNGFLHHMVRIMTGTLIEVGLKKRSENSISDLLAAKDRGKAGYMVPPEGLCLVEVFYS